MKKKLCTTTDFIYSKCLFISLYFDRFIMGNTCRYLLNMHMQACANIHENTVYKAKPEFVQF